MSKNQDAFTATIRGNLISEPNLVEDEEGNKVCYCKIATNPKAKRFDPKTNRELTAEERNKRRSFVELKIPRSAAAVKFHALFKKGDRAELVGELGTRREEKVFWSEKAQKYVTVKVDIDNDGKNVQEIYEDQIMMWVEDFSKVVAQEGFNVVMHA